MTHRFLMLALLLSATSSDPTPRQIDRSPNGQPCTQDHLAWVTQALVKMESIKPGMTRNDLLQIFTTEGGLSTGLRRTYVSRESPYFKVDVEFEAVGRPGHDADGRVTLVEGLQDAIAKISRPYLQFSIAD
jgi:hypothetical protein